jgi:hypothetical protein
MRKLLKVVNEAHACVEDIRTHAEGLDPEVLLEAMFLDDADFSEPTDAEAFLASMRKDALL